MNPITRTVAAKPSPKLTKGIPRITEQQREFILNNRQLGLMRLTEACRPLTYDQVRHALGKAKAGKAVA